MPKGYWAYAHDAQGELLADFGDFEHSRDAIDKVAHELVRMYPQFTGVTLRVVNHETQATIWQAGPVVPKVDPLLDFPATDDRDPVDVYGTPEHEAWLVEMERQEG